MRCALVTGVQSCALPISDRLYFSLKIFLPKSERLQRSAFASVRRASTSSTGLRRDPGVLMTSHQIDPMRVYSRRGVSVRSLPKRSEEHTSELQSLMRISYAVLCLKKKKKTQQKKNVV